MGGVLERQMRSARTILNSLGETHGKSLDDESLHTLLIEVESIVNSRPMTIETISDVNSCVPLSPSNILTMKSKVILPPPGSFSAADVYCRKRWRRVQHISNEFWSRWRKEYLQTLQERNSWKKRRRNFRNGDIVIIKADTERNKWPIARVIEAYEDRHGVVRTVKLKVGNDNGKQELVRPIAKIVLLLDDDSPTTGAMDKFKIKRKYEGSQKKWS